MKFPDTLSRPEEVEFMGTKYRLMGGLRRYYLSQSRSNSGRKGAKGLHVAIYEAVTQSVVRKNQICHHIDGNPFNNHPSNLAALTRAAHARHHGDQLRSEKQLAHLQAIRPLAKYWHSTEAGRQLHRSNGKAVWAKREKKAVSCVECGKLFSTRALEPRKYCGNYCNYLALKKTGRYDTKATCLVCKKTFICSTNFKGKKPETCGNSCRVTYGVQQRWLRAGLTLKKQAAVTLEELEACEAARARWASKQTGKPKLTSEQRREIGLRAAATRRKYNAQK